MTRSQAGLSEQWSLLSVVSPRRASALKRRLCQFSSIFLLAMFCIPVTGVMEAGVANAQIFQNSAQHARNARLNRARSRKRSRARARTRIVSRPKKSFFGSLFGSQPSGGNSSKPFQGLKSLFDGIQGKSQRAPRPASVRASYEKRMREAARLDANSANERLLSRSGRASTGWGYDPGRAASAAQSRWGKGRYRTMCVRMCDGYYFPVSFKASSNQLEADAQFCNSDCYNAPTKLFYYSNPGGDIENMRALDGVRYKDIANAFKYRKEYVKECRCKAAPWSRQARQQHESWGLQARNHAQDAKTPSQPIKQSPFEIHSEMPHGKSMGEMDMTSAFATPTGRSHAQY